MTKTLASIFISSAHADSAVVDRLEADRRQSGRRSGRVWHAWSLLWREEVLHA